MFVSSLLELRSRYYTFVVYMLDRMVNFTDPIVTLLTSFNV